MLEENNTVYLRASSVNKYRLNDLIKKVWLRSFSELDTEVNASFPLCDNKTCAGKKRKGDKGV